LSGPVLEGSGKYSWIVEADILGDIGDPVIRSDEIA